MAAIDERRSRTAAAIEKGRIEEEGLFPLLLRLFYCDGRSCLRKGCRSIAEALPKASPHQSESRRNTSAFIRPELIHRVGWH